MAWKPPRRGHPVVEDVSSTCNCKTNERSSRTRRRRGWWMDNVRHGAVRCHADADAESDQDKRRIRHGWILHSDLQLDTSMAQIIFLFFCFTKLAQFI